MSSIAPPLSSDAQAGQHPIVGRLAEIGLAGFVIAIVVTMVMRIDQSTLDALIALNLSISIAILFAALFVADGSKLPSFPTILLLSTLFRLALNVSSTKLVLLEADAGHIIEAFGQFVVGGDFVVGGVVFVVLVIVQFVVIAKGSERVAEVAARFTLDAMPGKQMSIDADLRNGLLDAEQAKRKRHELERESKLFGAMDGAMKFVKGDAIAGILISLVNLIGGIAIGAGRNGMSLGEAAEVYALLTIGDGLVSQVPALLSSVAAGLVVTRVASGPDGKASNAAREIVQQLLGMPRPLLASSVVLLACAISSPLTGLPWIPFAVLGGSALVLAIVRFARGGNADPSDSANPSADRDAAPARSAADPLVVSLSPTLAWLVEQPAALPYLADAFEEARHAFFDRTGVPVPFARTRLGPTLAPGVAAVSVYGLRVVETTAVGADAEEVASSIAGALAGAIDANAGEFVGVQEAAQLLEAIKPESAELVNALVPRQLALPQVADVLAELASGGASIRALRPILQSLVRHSTSVKDSAELVSRVRLDLRRALCQHLRAGLPALGYFTLDADVERRTQDALAELPDKPELALPTESRDAIAAGLPAGSVLACDAQVRRAVWLALRDAGSGARVVSYDELAGDPSARRLGSLPAA